MANQPIRRSSAAACVGEYERKGNVAPPTKPEPPTINMTFVGVNTSNDVVTPGDLIAVTGFYPSTLTYQRAKKLCLENRIKLAVSPTYPATGNAGVAVALTGARSGRLLYFKDAYQATYLADVNGATGQYVTKEGNATDDDSEAVAEILFSTAAVNGRRVALCMLVPPEGLSLEEVDDEIDTTLATKLKTKNIIVGFVPTITNDGYLHLGSSYNSIKYYGEQ